MRKRLAWELLSLGILAACRGVSHPCRIDSDCEAAAYCERSIGACVARNTCPPCASNEDCVGTTCVPRTCPPCAPNEDCVGITCVPRNCQAPCAPYEECAGITCVPRYSALRFVNPLDGAVVPAFVNVQAQLVLAVGRTRNDPAQLPYSAVQSDGGSAQSGVLGLQSGGLYVNTWNPSGEGPYQLSVSFPDAGLSSTESVLVKKTGPNLTITVGSPPPRIDAGFDAGATSGYDADLAFARAWRRDETATIAFFTNDAFLDVSSVFALLAAPDGGGITTAGLSAPVVNICDGGYCGSMTADLAQVNFPAFRGNVEFILIASDVVGNFGAADAGIAVTRWKWRYSFLAGMPPIYASPAIGDAGTIYVSASFSPTNGTTVALKPDGTELWTFNDGGSTRGSPAVGVAPDAGERIYLAAKTDAGVNFYVLDGTVPSQAPVCSLLSTTAEMVGSPAVNQTDAGEAAFFVVNDGGIPDGGLWAVRPDVAAPLRCPSATGYQSVAFPSGVVTDGTSEFFGNSVPAVHQYVLDGGSWDAGWTAPSFQNIHGLSLSGASIIGGAGIDGGSPRGSLLSFQTSTGSATLLLDGGILWYPSIVGAGPGATAVVSVNHASGNFLALANVQTGADGGTFPMTDSMHGAPAIGSDHHIYVANYASQVFDLSPGLTPSWSISVGGANGVEASPALDCARGSDGSKLPGRPGVLYIATTTGSLYSFIVDSRGIDVTAAWPKYQHDPRNTGNSSVPLTPFACP